MTSRPAGLAPQKRGERSLPRGGDASRAGPKAKPSRRSTRGADPRELVGGFSQKPLRLQVILARAGVASRRRAEALIVAGRVAVDGQVVAELGTRVSPGQHVALDGRALRAEPQIYVLLHKPRAVMCTMADPEGRRTVADCLSAVAARVVPVGRLDYQTSGALLMTNDGVLARALLHPSRKVAKRYELVVKGRVDARGLSIMRSSVRIDGRATRPADVQLVRSEARSTTLSVVLREGRNRQIRRLAESAGLAVHKLARTHFAGLSVDSLGPGSFRLLAASEVQHLRQLSQRPIEP